MKVKILRTGSTFDLQTMSDEWFEKNQDKEILKYGTLMSANEYGQQFAIEIWYKDKPKKEF